MTDVVNKATRSEMMSGIKGKNTKPELIIRSGLHRSGFRFRLHRRYIPGNPDIILPKHSALIFVPGCFWHGHDCHLFKWPSTRPEFWKAKIETNRARDVKVLAQLADTSWRVAQVWECALKGKSRLAPDQMMEKLCGWIEGADPDLVVRSAQPTSATFA